MGVLDFHSVPRLGQHEAVLVVVVDCSIAV